MNVIPLDGQDVSDRDYRRISEFLFREATLLDGGRFLDWLGLLTEDIRFRLVAPSVAMSRAGGGDTSGEVLLMDETLASLKARTQQLSTPSYTVSENPRSFTRRFVTNILVGPGADDGVVDVHSNVLVYQNRLTETQPRLFSISRTDGLTRSGSGFLLTRRSARLDTAIIGASTVSTLF